MSAISVRLPDSLHKKVREVAQRDNISINQMITVAVAEKLAALETEDYLGRRSKKRTRAKYLKALRNVPDRKPDRVDQL